MSWLCVLGGADRFRALLVIQIGDQRHALAPNGLGMKDTLVRRQFDEKWEVKSGKSWRSLLPIRRSCLPIYPRNILAQMREQEKAERSKMDQTPPQLGYGWAYCFLSQKAKAKTRTRPSGGRVVVGTSLGWRGAARSGGGTF